MLTSKIFMKSFTNEPVPIRFIRHTCDTPPPPTQYTYTLFAHHISFSAYPFSSYSVSHIRAAKYLSEEGLNLKNA